MRIGAAGTRRALHGRASGSGSERGRACRAALWGSAGALSLLASPALAQSAADPSTITLDPIEVQGAAGRPVDSPEGTTGYVATQSRAGAKTDTPVREIPQSVSVVTRKQLDDRNVQTLADAINYTPGVQTNNFGFDSRYDIFYIRGFYAGNDIYRDGLRQGAANFSDAKVEPYGLESLSILRGPASGLYGLTAPGGIVNVITKRPPDTAFGEVQVQVGQYDRYQGAFDVGAPVPGHEEFSYRLTGLYRDAKTFLPFENDDRTYIAPAFRWQPDADTSITFLSEYQKSTVSGNPYYYFDAANNRATDIYQNDPRYGDLDREQYRLGYEAEHRFSDLLTVRQNFRYYHLDTDYKSTSIYAVDEAAQTASRSTFGVKESFDTINLDNQAESRFRLGATDNTLLFGVNYNHYLLHSKTGFGLAPDLNLATKNYGAQAIAAPAFSSFTRQVLDEVGVYAQEQMRLGHVLLTLTGQESRVWQHTVTNPAGTDVDQNDSAFTGRVGLAYLFDNGLAPYISYATSYAPQAGVGADGSPFDPTDGEQGEIGIKYQMPAMPVLLTAALFDIRQTNVLRTDPDNIAFQSATGEVESRGVELEATATLMQGFDLTAAYSHLNVEINRGADDTTGNEFSGIPRDSATLFGKYTFQPGSRLAGLGIGAGVRFSGRSYGNDQNTFENSSVTLVDAVLDYDVGQINHKLDGTHLQVNATNLFDRQFQNCIGGFCGQGERQQVIGTLSYRF